MSWHAVGNKPITAATASTGIANPSTTTLVVELDSTLLGTNNFAAGQSRDYQVSWCLGSNSTVLTNFVGEVATSTALNASTVVFPIVAPYGQSGLYVNQVRLEKDYRLRVRVASTFTGSAWAWVQAVELI